MTRVIRIVLLAFTIRRFHTKPKFQLKNKNRVLYAGPGFFKRTSSRKNLLK